MMCVIPEMMFYKSLCTWLAVWILSEGLCKVISLLFSCNVHGFANTDLAESHVYLAILTSLGVGHYLLPAFDLMKTCVWYIQALIRTIDPETGLVGLQKLEETPYYDLLEQISFLKAARIEASYIDIETVRQKTCLIVTEGKHGSRVYSKDHEYRIPAFPATEVDPTGAGDSFLAGFSAGLYQGLPVEQAVLMGNYFGGLAVGQVGIPKFLPTHLEVFLQPSRKHFT